MTTRLYSSGSVITAQDEPRTQTSDHAHMSGLPKMSEIIHKFVLRRTVRERAQVGNI